MRIHRSLLGWGVFLVVLGLVPLGVRQGVLDADVVANAWQLWPLVLVGAGIGLVLRGTRAEVAGGLIVALTFGLIGGSIIATGARLPFAGGCGSMSDGQAFPSQQGTLGAAARVSLELDCGEATVTTAPGAGWTLSGTAQDGRAPNVDASADRLRITSRDRRDFAFGAGDQWDVVLPEGSSMRVDVTVNAGSASLDLGGARVPEVSASVNAGSIVLDLGDAVEVGRLDASANAGSLSITLPAQALTGSVSANAGSVEVCIPTGVGVRITTGDNPIASYDFSRAGLTKSGDAWETAGFGSAATTIRLSASANAGSISLNPEGGCND